MLESRFGSIISRSSTDVGRTKLHTLDVQVTEGSPVFVKQYTIPLKYKNFIDNETKRLEEAGLISRSLSNWSAPCMVVPKKQDPDNPHEVQLRMVIDSSTRGSLPLEHPIGMVKLERSSQTTQYQK